MTAEKNTDKWCIDNRIYEKQNENWKMIKNILQWCGGK
jgi:hypothetical protein